MKILIHFVTTFFCCSFLQTTNQKLQTDKESALYMTKKNLMLPSLCCYTIIFYGPDKSCHKTSAVRQLHLQPLQSPWE